MAGDDRRIDLHEPVVHGVEQGDELDGSVEVVLRLVPDHDDDLVLQLLGPDVLGELDDVRPPGAAGHLSR
jgi:hypothetical protein